MQKLTQKYAIVHLIDNLPVGYEFSMSDWPLHITLADVFAIDGNSAELIIDLETELSSHPPIQSSVMGDDWFGENKSVHVKLINKTEELQQLHETILSALSNYKVNFNNPKYTRKGFKPHSTVQKSSRLNFDDTVTLDSLSLIDMFPASDPYKRRIVGTIQFQKI